MDTQALNRIYVPLWLCYGLVPIIAGADKFTNVLTDWSKYLPGFMTNVVPVSPHTFMMGVGVIEIVAGLAVLTVLPRLGAYVVALWLVLIAGAVTITGFYDIAVRDLAMALGAYTLGSVAALRGEAIIPSKRRTTEGGLAVGHS
ncbi:MAG: DoxX family membrane protein [Phycisphaeraceae bacterium]|nr:DoxX family membrane protein [Phycisphaeraceae bacterium]